MNNQGASGDAALIAANICRGMDAKGLSAKGVAEALGISEQIAYRWRKGYGVPNGSNIKALADLLFDGDANQLYWPAEDSAA